MKVEDPHPRADQAPEWGARATLRSAAPESRVGGMAESSKPAGRDVALLYAPTDDGKGARVVRARDGALETGEVRPVKDGQPINRGELVRLLPREGTPAICDVEVLHASAEASSEPAASPDALLRGRPAQVANDDYRTNWDRTFGASARRAKGDRSLN